LQLPGFAGQPALVNRDKDFLITMRDSVEHYMRQKKLGKVVLIGHSLGGTLSLMIALDAPEAVKQLVIIDALPFFSAAQNPALTVEMARPQAEMMRNAMNNQPIEEYNKNAVSNVQGMTNDSSRLPTLVKWMTTSDRNTTTTAMYELMTTDLRQSISGITQPILVLGAWAAYKPYGSTKESTKAIYTAQYAQAKHVDVRMSETSYHFIPWDDSQWLNEQINDFLK
jgi:pimeloyl-ACP methyl ester carboxylesterase